MFAKTVNEFKLFEYSSPNSREVLLFCIYFQEIDFWTRNTLLYGLIFQSLLGYIFKRSNFGRNWLALNETTLHAGIINAGSKVISTIIIGVQTILACFFFESFLLIVFFHTNLYVLSLQLVRCAQMNIWMRITRDLWITKAPAIRRATACNSMLTHTLLLTKFGSAGSITDLICKENECNCFPGKSYRKNA